MQKVPLACSTLGLLQSWRLALKLVSHRLEAIALLNQFLFTLGKLLLQLGLRRLGCVRFFKYPIGTDKPDADFLRLSLSADQQPTQHNGGATTMKKCVH